MITNTYHLFSVLGFVFGFTGFVIAVCEFELRAFKKNIKK